MQKVTITALTLNEAMREVKKRFGDEAVIEKTEEANDRVKITVAILDDGDSPILAPSLPGKEVNRFRIENPLSAIRFVESVCERNYLGRDFRDFWLKKLSPYLVLIDVDLTESFSECLNFEPRWPLKLLKEKPVIFLGAHGSGKTQALAKVAASLKARDRAVGIYDLDTVKASGQGMLENYAKKMDLPYSFGQDAWRRLLDDAKHAKDSIKLVDTPGTDPSSPETVEWLAPYTRKFGFETVMVLAADSCVSQTPATVRFIENFRVHRLIVGKTDVSKAMGFPVRVAWLSGAPLAMANGSARLGDDLSHLSAQSLLKLMVSAPRAEPERAEPARFADR